MTTVGEAIHNAIAYLKAHPDEARYTDSAAVARLESRLKVTAMAPNGRSITTDMSKGVGGSDSAQSPGWLFRAALAACDATLIAMRAAMLRVELSHLEDWALAHLPEFMRSRAIADKESAAGKTIEAGAFFRAQRRPRRLKRPIAKRDR